MRIFFYALLILSLNAESHADDLLNETAAQNNDNAKAIEVVTPWTRRAIGARNTVIYMEVVNLSDTDHKLIDAHSPNCQRIELHDHHNEDGVMRMRRVGLITIPHKGNIKLKPGGKHLMCMGLNRDLHKGDVIHLDLKFDDNKTVPVNVLVRNQF